MPQDWVDRLSSSLRAHEGDRDAARESLPPYEIQGELGRGGMGVVYRAHDPELNRELAVKVLVESAATTPEARARFVREAQVASQLDHPNIVSVYHAGEWMGQAYLAIQLIHGTTIDKAKLDLRPTLEALRDAARALHYAHGKGVVHRDVKPTNIMIDESGRAYIMDFGIARRVDVPAKLTVTGVIMGTPCYMSPEQVHGRPADARSDVYALGATMYDLLAGRPPFHEDDMMATLKAISDREPPPPRHFNPTLPSVVEKIILKAIEKEPVHRYASATDLADDIQRYLDGEPIHARPAPLGFKVRRTLSRNRGTVITAALAAAALLATWLFLTGVDPELRRFDRAIKQGSVAEAKRVCAELEAEYASDPRFQDLKTALQNQIDRDLRGDLQLLIRMVLDPDLGGAKSLVEKMRTIPMGKPHALVEEAAGYLENADAADKEFKSLKSDFASLLGGGKDESAWNTLQKLRGIRVKGLDQPFKNATQEYESLRNRLVRKLEGGIGRAERTPLAELRLLKVVDPGAYSAAVEDLDDFRRLYWEIFEENPTSSRFREAVAEMERLAGTPERRTELRLVLDQYALRMRNEWGALDPAARLEKCREHAVSAFGDESIARLDVLVTFARESDPGKVGDGGQVREMEQARALLALSREFDAALGKDLEAAARNFEAARKAKYGPGYAGKASGMLDVLARSLATARVKGIASDIARVRERLDLREAKRLEALLMKSGLPEKDPVVRSALRDLEDLERDLNREFDERLSDLGESAKGGRTAEFESRFEELKGKRYWGVRDREPRIAEKLLVLARTRMDRGEIARALRRLDEGIALTELTRKNWELYAVRGVLRRDREAWSAAKADWLEALRILEKLPGANANGRLLLERAVLCRRLAEFKDGIAVARRLVEVRKAAGGKQHAEALLLLGQLLYLEGMAKKDRGASAGEAVRRLEEAVRLDPNNGRIRFWLGTAKHFGSSGEAPGSLGDTLSELERAARMGVRSHHLSYQRARIYVETQKDPGRAETLMSDVLDPREELDDDGYVAGLHELARRALGDARKAFRRDCLVIRARARFLIAEPPGRPPAPDALKGCFTDCQEAIGLDEDSSTARLYRGMVFYKWGRFAEARKDFEKVMATSPYPLERKSARDWYGSIPENQEDPKK